MPSDLREALRAVVEERTPHNTVLGMRLLTAAAGEATCAVPYAEMLVDDAAKREIHSGVITAVLDVASGAAVCMTLGRLQPMATRGLRVDFLRRPRPGQSITAHAHCFGISGSLAFVRASAYDNETGDPVAASQTTYALIDAGATR